jgi:hypothetical protein
MPSSSNANDLAERLRIYRPVSDADTVHLLADVWRLVNENNNKITNLEALMADVSGVLNEVADGLRGPLATSITELIDENKRLAAEAAVARGEADALQAEDAGESAAAQNVRAAFDEVAAKFSADPGAPDVDPLPAPGGGEEPAPVPGPGEGEVTNPTPVDENGNPV